MKPKKKYNPDTQMKRANWTKVNARQVEKDSFWVRSKEEELEDDDIFATLKMQFASKAPGQFLCNTELLC